MNVAITREVVMDREVKIKWINALRSGEYKQGYGSLRSVDNKYCCLGVLCNILEPELWEYVDSAKVYRHRNQLLFPSEVLMNSIGIESIEVQDTLAGLNDKEGLNFNAIADWIEENL